MRSVWNEAERRELKERLDRLTPQHAAKWGRLTAPQMVVHLADALRMATGEIAVAPKNMVLRYTPLKQLVIYWLPFPKGAPTAPELLARTPADWPAETADLHAELDRLAARGPAALVETHPAFGRLTGRDWGVLIYRHMDHHLRQFGV